MDDNRITLTIQADNITNHKARSSKDIPVILSIYGAPSLASEPDLAWAFNQAAKTEDGDAVLRPTNKESDTLDEGEEKPLTPLEQHRIDLERSQRVAIRAQDIMGQAFQEGGANVALLPVMDQPSGMKTTLLKHQLQGLRWM